MCDVCVCVCVCVWRGFLGLCACVSGELGGVGRVLGPVCVW